MPVGQAPSSLFPSAPVPGTLAHARLSVLASLLPLQGLLKKHEAFETDFTVHKDRVNDVCTNGQDLIKKVSKTLVPMPDACLLVPPSPTQTSSPSLPQASSPSPPQASSPSSRVAKGLRETISSPIPVFCKAGEQFHSLDVSPF